MPEVEGIFFYIGSKVRDSQPHILLTARLLHARGRRKETNEAQKKSWQAVQVKEAKVLRKEEEEKEGKGDLKLLENQQRCLKFGPKGPAW